MIFVQKTPTVYFTRELAKTPTFLEKFSYISLKYFEEALVDSLKK